jgi:hypothetical protein
MVMSSYRKAKAMTSQQTESKSAVYKERHSRTDVCADNTRKTHFFIKYSSLLYKRVLINYQKFKHKSDMEKKLRGPLFSRAAL